MWSKIRNILAAVMVSLIALAVLLAWFSSHYQVSYAQSDDVFCVVSNGTVTETFSTCDVVFTSLQTAVSTSVGGEKIWVAAGVYTDVYNINGHMQIAYIDKELSIHGGYLAPFDVPPDPEINHTILDAEQNGRVFYIAPGAVVTLTGLQITGGDATDEGRDGGGLYARDAQVLISGTQIYENVAYWPLVVDPYDSSGGSGGGLFVEQSGVTLTNNIISGNLAAFQSLGVGGGIYIVDSQYLVTGNEILSNTAQLSGTETAHDAGWGGGVAIWQGNGRFDYNILKYNLAADSDDVGFGGGLFIEDDRPIPSPFTMTHNLIAHNIASQNFAGYGGGVHFMRWPSDGEQPWFVLMHQNHIQENVALVDGTHGYAGAIAVLRGFTVLTMTNNTIISNTAGISAEVGFGGGLVSGMSTIHSRQNQFIGNKAAITATVDGRGGAAYYDSSLVTHKNDIFMSNQAVQSGAGYGGAVYQDVDDLLSDEVMHTRMVNTVLNRNQASETGTAIMADQQSRLDITHGTIANNQGAGAAVHLGTPDNNQNINGRGNTMWMTNTILSGNETGLYIGSYNEAVIFGVLWHDVQTAVSLAPFAAYFPYYQTVGAPLFTADGYHIQPGSAAIQRGVPSSLSLDIDGQARPYTPTLGVDEYWLTENWLPSVIKN